MCKFLSRQPNIYMELFQISPQAGYPPFWSTNRTELFGLIARGKYSLPDQEWKSISDGAKRLIKSMVRDFFRGLSNIILLIQQ